MRKFFKLGRDDIGDVAHRPGRAQRADHRGSQCAGAAGDDDMRAVIRDHGQPSVAAIPVAATRPVIPRPPRRSHHLRAASADGALARGDILGARGGDGEHDLDPAHDIGERHRRRAATVIGDARRLRRQIRHVQKAAAQRRRDVSRRGASARKKRGCRQRCPPCSTRWRAAPPRAAPATAALIGKVAKYAAGPPGTIVRSIGARPSLSGCARRRD